MVSLMVWNDPALCRFHGMPRVPGRSSGARSAGSNQPVILVAMPDALVLLDVAAVIRGLGFRNIVTVATAATFRAAMIRGVHDAAILDCDFLNGIDAGTISELAALNHRLLLLSGYGSDFSLPAALSAATLLPKPLPTEAIVRHLAGLQRSGEA